MDKLLEQIYYILEENVPLDFQKTPEYRQCSEKYDQLWGQIAAELGPGGNARLNNLMNAKADEDRPWQFAIFRRTLALGITLGRLSYSSF